MALESRRRRIWGWYFFDWASQPYSTLLVSFIFAPYVKEIIGDGARAQSLWGLTVGASGVAIALLGPVVGAVVDTRGDRMRWIWLFSALYIGGSAGLWLAMPDGHNLALALWLFAIGLVGMELATILVNSMLPQLGERDEVGRISGSGWAFGYLGGLIALVIALGLFAEDARTGRTLFGIAPALGLDPAAREGTRAIGPLTAIWYAAFMIPFFLWVRDPGGAAIRAGGLADGLANLARTIRSLPRTPSLLAFLAASMSYRDALTGMYFFGGIYAAGVLGWSVVDVGIFGIVGIVSGAAFAWIGGRADDRFGPRPVVAVCVAVLFLSACSLLFVTRESVFGVAVAPDSRIPDLCFYAMGAFVGGAGGVVQAAGRSMMTRLARPERMAEAFGLYALAGRATGFVVPLSIGVITGLSDSQRIGAIPLIALFALGFVLLRWVKPEGDG